MTYSLHMLTHRKTPSGTDSVVTWSEAFVGNCPYKVGDTIEHGGADWEVTEISGRSAIAQPTDIVIVTCERNAEG